MTKAKTKSTAPAWAEQALTAWQQHLELTRREASDRHLAAVERASRWWQQVGLGLLPEVGNVHDTERGVRIPLDTGAALEEGLRLAVVIPERGRAVLLELYAGDGWQPAGELGTAADLGRVLVDGPDDMPARRPPTTAELLLQVLEALVDDAVGRRLDGTL